MLSVLAKARSLQEIADAAVDLLGNPVFFTDMSHTILAYTRSVEIEDKIWKDTVINGSLDRNICRQNLEIERNHVDSRKTGLPVLAHDASMPHQRLIKLMMDEDKPIGVLISPAILKPICEQDIEILELISSFAISCSQKERFAFLANRKSVSNILIQLLDGAQMSHEFISKRLDILDWKPLKYQYVVALWRNEEIVDKTRVGPIIERLSEFPHCRAVLYDNSIVFVYTSKNPVSNFSENIQLDELAQKWGLSAGVSQCFSGLEKLKAYYGQAVAAYRLGRLLRKPGNFLLYDTISAYHMLEMLSGSVSLRMFCHRKVLDLEAHDSGDAKLVPTLHAYLENTKSMAKTAAQLFLHRNTVRYRINKCMEVMESDFSDSNETFAFILSLRILEYERRVSGQSEGEAAGQQM
jgi:hypothetical protein